MDTISASAKKILFNKDASEALTQEESEAWNAFIAWDAYNSGTRDYYHPDLINGMPLTYVPEINKEQNRKKTLAEKINFHNLMIIKALKQQLILEAINEKAWQELCQLIGFENKTEPKPGHEEVSTAVRKKISRLPKWMWIAAGLIVLIFAALIMFNKKPPQTGNKIVNGFHRGQLSVS